MKIPKKVLSVIKYYNSCYKEKNRCLHCADCIAFALIYSEIVNSKIEKQLQKLKSGDWVFAGEVDWEWLFTKFLLSTITREYLPCDRALPDKIILDFASKLLFLPVEERRKVRKMLMAHSEFLGEINGGDTIG